MRLYLFIRGDYADYDEYVGAVIAAKNIKVAKEIILRLGNYDWKCTLISKTASPRIKEGIILASFSAG